MGNCNLNFRLSTPLQGRPQLWLYPEGERVTMIGIRQGSDSSHLRLKLLT